MRIPERSWGLLARCIALGFGVAWVGCSGGGDAGTYDRWSGRMDTATDGRVTVTNTGGGAWTQDTVRARRTLLIGETGITGGTEATTFGDIISLAVDDAGRMFVGDGQSNTVRAYGPDGRHMGLVGGEGQGPGEFRVPDGLAFGPRGRLYVADLGGITVMEDRSDRDLPTSQVHHWSPVTYLQVFRPLRVTCDGIVYFPHSEGRPEVNLYLRFDRDGTQRDTVRVPRLEGLPQGVPHLPLPGGGRMLMGLDHVPLAPVPSWDVTPSGRLVLGEARSYRLLVLGAAGDTIRVVRREVDRRPVAGTVRRESTEALRTRLDTLPAPTDRIRNLPRAVAELELPTHYPPFLQVHAGEGGRMWVERPPLHGRPRTTPYDVFDRSGVYLGTVMIPGRFDHGRGLVTARSRPRPVFTDGEAYGVVKDSVTGVQRVARFSFELPEREAWAPPPPAPPCTTVESDLSP